MKAYKGFNRKKNGTLWCLDFKYEVGKTYKHEGDIELCESGFHACHELHQVWFFYPNNGNNVFYEVECGGKIIESDADDGKFVCSEIRLVREVNMSDVEKFNEAWSFCEGFARVELDGKWNYINTSGNLLSEQWFDDAYPFYEGFAHVKLDGKWNYIDTSGNLLSEQWYDSAGDFHEGFATVKLNGKWNFIDTKGKLLLEQWNDDAVFFHKGFAQVKIDGKWHKIDTNGKIIKQTFKSYDKRTNNRKSTRNM